MHREAWGGEECKHTKHAPYTMKRTACAPYDILHFCSATHRPHDPPGVGTATGVVSPLFCVVDSVTEVAVDVVDEVVMVVDELVVGAGSGIRVGGDSTSSTNFGCGA